MKKKNLFMTLGLALSLGVGVFAGLSAKQEVREAKAAGTVEYRFTNNYSWKYIKAYAWVSTDTSQNNNWDTGGVMSESYTNESGQTIYTVTLDAKYDRLIFHGRNYEDNCNVQTYDLEIGDNHGFYIYGDKNYYEGADHYNAGSYNLTSTYYLYDYDNKFGGTVYANAWNNTNDSLNNGNPGTLTTKLTNIAANGLIYSVNLDVKYDRLEWNIGSDTLKVSAGQPTNNYVYIYDPESHIASGPTGGTWNDNLNYVVAHNWWANLMNFRNVSAVAGAGADGTTCEDLYSNAKTSYNNFNSYMKTEVKNDYYEALERMVKWAEHHHETFVIVEGIGSFSLAIKTPTGVEAAESNTSLIVIIAASAIAVLALGGYFFVRSRKED